MTKSTQDNQVGIGAQPPWGPPSLLTVGVPGVQIAAAERNAANAPRVLRGRGRRFQNGRDVRARVPAGGLDRSPVRRVIAVHNGVVHDGA